jgi:plastocyanin
MEAIMKQCSAKIIMITLWATLGAVSLILPPAVHAAIHVVQFGGALGLVYAPANFAANVGDTVQWNGAFSMHPLSSTTIPAGAATWHNATGTTFSYVIRVAGTYNYQCDLHIALGMIASFTAATSAVFPLANMAKKRAPEIVFFSLAGKTFIRLNMGAAEFVSVTFFTLGGKKAAVLVNTKLGSGSYDIPIPEIGPGSYFVRLIAGEQRIIKNVLVTR